MKTTISHLIVKLIAAAMAGVFLAACSEAPLANTEQQALTESQNWLASNSDFAALEATKSLAATVNDEQSSAEDVPLYACLLNPGDDESEEILLNLIVDTEENGLIAIVILADRGPDGPENGEPLTARQVQMESVTLPDDQTEATVFHSPGIMQLISSDSPEDNESVHPGFFNGILDDEVRTIPTVCIDLQESSN